MSLLLLALALFVLGGIAAFLLSAAPRAATLTGASSAAAGCLLALIPTLGVLLDGDTLALRFAWDDAHGAFSVALDGLSAFFLLPVLVLAGLAAVYGADYLLAYRHEKRLGAPWLFFNLFVAGMTLVVIARTVFLFLAAWEVMSIAAYFLVTFEHEKAEVRRAGWVYLVATHLGVAFLFVAFLLLGGQAGSLDFAALRALPQLSPVLTGLVFGAALIGFGAKAGFVPFHVWLPEAHPAAPSHVSALMSGVMIKMGLYGLLRVLTFLGAPAPWWGATLASLGLLTALVGVALALSQRDIKRVLAYSSIENIGLIALALGLGLWGWANHLPALAALAVTAGLLHIWNHSLMKGLMFFAAGSVLHGAGTKDMEKLGGLLRRMPWTGGLMIAGAVAIAALPPLNGFVGKWLLYLGLFHAGLDTDSGNLSALLSVGLLALIGGLAAVAFVRLAGVVLLGAPRSEAAAQAQESSPWLLGPMALLALFCVGAALFPGAITGLFTAALRDVLGPESSDSWTELQATQAPLATVGWLNLATWLVGGAVAGVFFLWLRRAPRATAPTWGCGYPKPTARIQYTGRSFAELLVTRLLPRWLRPRIKLERPQGLFPQPTRFGTETPDPVSHGVYEPFFRRWAWRFTRLRILQQGNVHTYLIYIMLVVVVALTWASLRAWWIAS